MKCPKCGCYREHIYTFEISPKTSKHWAVERCPHCQFGFDVTLYADYLLAKNTKKSEPTDPGRDVRSNDAGWRYGL